MFATFGHPPMCTSPCCFTSLSFITHFPKFPTHYPDSQTPSPSDYCSPPPTTGSMIFV